MAVVTYMIDALNFFKNKPHDDISEIAIDIAMHGHQGFSTSKNDYRITTLPDRTFTGYEILAWYYVSWALSKPDLLSELGLPFEREYGVACGGGIGQGWSRI
jgi:hypothetical protein